MAGVSYSPPWWVSLLHRLPHLSLRWELTAADFRPHDAEYQQVGPGTGALRIWTWGYVPRGFPSQPEQEVFGAGDAERARHPSGSSGRSGDSPRLGLLGWVSVGAMAPCAA